MQDLINKLTEKVGLDADQAKGAVDTVMEFVKSKLPDGLADKVDDMFGGAEGEKVEFGGIMDSLMGMFGGAKDKAGEAMEGAGDMFDTAKDKAGDMLDDAKDKAGDMLEDAGEKMEDLGDAAADMAKDAIDKFKGMFGGDKK